MTILSYTNRTLYSASVHNSWQHSAFRSYDLAQSARACFNGVAQDYGDDVFYLYYTGDTDTVHYAVDGSVDFTINGTTYSVTAGDGTFAVSGLTAGTVYEVTTSRGSSATTIYWLGFQVTVNNTSAPTFNNTAPLAVSDVSDMYDALSEAETAANILPIPQAKHELLSWFKDIGDTVGDARDFFHGGFIGGADDLDFNISTVAQNASETTIRIKAYIDGTERFNQTYTGTAQTTGINIDLSALSLTAGTVYELQLTAQAEGDTTLRLYFDVTLNSLATSSTPSSAIAPESEFSRGDAPTTTALNKMRDCLDYAHPRNGTHPLQRDLCAIRSSADDFRLQHKRNYLRYEATSGSTPQLTYNAGTIDLSSDSGTQTYDLTKLSDLARGEYYTVTDCKFAIEDDTDA